MAKKPIPTPEQLRQLLSYDHDTGFLYWKRRDVSWFDGNLRSTAIWNARYAGKRAFRQITPFGYASGKIMDYSAQAHRVIWAWHKGAWPVLEIDHINRDKLDNRIENLREVSRGENERNKDVSTKSKTGEKGVYRTRSGTFSANYFVNRDRFHIGTYASVKEAAMARAEFLTALDAARGKP